MSRGSRKVKGIQTVLLVAGLVLVGYATVTYIRGRMYSHVEVARFDMQSTSQHHMAPGGLNGAAPVDVSLWSEKRVKEYEATLAEHFDAPQGILRMKKIGLEVAVFDGTDDRVLNRGVGRIIGTARIGESGNVGIAGHRDGFFSRAERRRRGRHHGTANRHGHTDLRDRVDQDSYPGRR